MSNFTLTIDAAFTDGVGNSMDPTHWTTPLVEVESLLQGRVGRDGVGIDNWSGAEALRGLNFRDSGLAEVWRRQIDGESWGTARHSPTASIPRPAPGGAHRFYLRETADLLVLYNPRLAGAVSPNTYSIAKSFDGGLLTPLNEYIIANATHDGADVTMPAFWVEATVSPGWHHVTHWARETTVGVDHLVFGRTDLTIIAIYR